MQTDIISHQDGCHGPCGCAALIDAISAEEFSILTRAVIHMCFIAPHSPRLPSTFLYFMCIVCDATAVSVPYYSHSINGGAQTAVPETSVSILVSYSLVRVCALIWRSHSPRRQRLPITITCSPWEEKSNYSGKSPDDHGHSRSLSPIDTFWFWGVFRQSRFYFGRFPKTYVVYLYWGRAVDLAAIILHHQL